MIGAGPAPETLADRAATLFRGFRAGDSEAQHRLERVGEFFLSGYHAALETDNDGELDRRLRALASIAEKLP